MGRRQAVCRRLGRCPPVREGLYPLCVGMTYGRIGAGRPAASAHRTRHRGEGEGAGSARECCPQAGVPARRGRLHGQYARASRPSANRPRRQGDRRLARGQDRRAARPGRRKAHCVLGGLSREGRYGRASWASHGGPSKTRNFACGRPVCVHRCRGGCGRARRHARMWSGTLFPLCLQQRPTQRSCGKDTFRCRCSQPPRPSS